MNATNELNSPPPPVATGAGWSSRRQIQTLVLVLAIVAGLFICLRLTAPFLAPLVWALTLAVLFTPLHRRIEAKIARPNVAATITVLLVALVVLIVAAFVGARLVSEVVKGATVLKTLVESGDLGRTIESYPFIAPLGRWIEHNTDLSAALSGAASWLATKGASFVQGSVVQLIAVLLTFYFLFFLLRDRRNALRSIKSLVAIPGEAMNRLGRRISETIHATVYGTLVVAAVQGTMGGLMFWVLGLPAPVLWGIVMGMLAVVPVLGAFIIWIPAAIVLAVDGSWARAIVLTAWGSIVIGGIDNLLYPMLVGNRLQMHTVVAFIAMIGGLAVFGAAGIILGPVAVTVTSLLLEIWRNRPPESGEPDSPAPTS
jgi:predicted PurR-regulated permease PerM